MQSAFSRVATRLMANPLTGLAPLTHERHLPGVLHPPSGRLQRRRDLRQTATPADPLPLRRRDAVPAYVVGDIHITDPVAFRAHVPIALATVARHGGRVVAGGDKIELLDGGPIPDRLIIIEFPDIETARRWYRSDEYQAALKVRLSTSHGCVFLIEGVEPAMRPAWPRPESEA
jgi:uncharacterized protein (DUF1330 family)